MGNRGGPSPAGMGRAVAAVVILGVLRLAAALTAAPLPRSGAPRRQPARVVTVLALAEDGFRKNEIWKVDLTHTLMHVSQILEEYAGIKFRIKTFDYWSPGPGASGGPEGRSRQLAGLLAALKAHLAWSGRGTCDIVIGLASEEREEPMKGMADYPEGIVLLQYFEQRGRMEYVLLHELCHLLGAVDLAQEHSVMSRPNPSFRIDDFTRNIMRINRARSFRPGECPLAADDIREAIALYRERQDLGLPENELVICLRILKSWQGASRPSGTVGMRKLKGGRPGQARGRP